MLEAAHPQKEHMVYRCIIAVHRCTNAVLSLVAIYVLGYAAVAWAQVVPVCSLPRHAQDYGALGALTVGPGMIKDTNE